MHFTHMCVNTHTTICHIHNQTDYSIHSIVTIHNFFVFFMEMFYIYVLTYLHYRLMSTRMYDIPEAKKESVYLFFYPE